jgi:hypothetical protein
MLVVTHTDDNVNEAGTLRFAVAHAQSGDAIQLTGAVKDGITLTQGDLVLSQNVTIEAVGNRAITISGGGNSRIFEINPGVQGTLDQLNLTNGNGIANNPNDTSGLDANGGAILSFGTLTINNSTLDDNFAGDGGGAILNDGGTLTVNNSTLSNNSTTGLSGVNGVGGAIWNFEGTLTVNNSFLSANSATGGGGAILNEGLLTVSNSTLSDNIDLGNVGGAIWNFATMTVSNSTLSRNAADFGGAVFNQGGTATVTGSTLSDNIARFDGGAIYNFFGALSVGTSSFSGNFPDNIVGGFNDLGGNSGLP